MLSLDPQTTCGVANEARFDFSEVSLEEQQTQALGNVAQEGAQIQFFALEQSQNKKALADVPSETTETRSEQTLVFGATPSRIDEVPDAKSDEKGSVSVLRGHFGCVSESGIFYSFARAAPPSVGINSPVEPKWSSFSTKIDLPYSYVYSKSISKGNRLSTSQTPV